MPFPVEKVTVYMHKKPSLVQNKWTQNNNILNWKYFVKTLSMATICIFRLHYNIQWLSKMFLTPKGIWNMKTQNKIQFNRPSTIMTWLSISDTWQKNNRFNPRIHLCTRIGKLNCIQNAWLLIISFFLHIYMLTNDLLPSSSTPKGHRRESSKKYK